MIQFICILNFMNIEGIGNQNIPTPQSNYKVLGRLVEVNTIVLRGVDGSTLR